MYKLIVFMLVMVLGISVSAQNSNVGPICEVYGAIQKVNYSAAYKSCETLSDSEDCGELFEAFTDLLGEGVQSKSTYKKVNVEGCTIVLSAVEDGIVWTIENVDALKGEVSQLYNYLSQALSDTNLESCN